MNLTNSIVLGMCSRLTERQQWRPGETMTLAQARVCGKWHSIYLVEDDLTIRLRASGGGKLAPVVGMLTRQGWATCPVPDQDIAAWRQANATVLRILERRISVRPLGHKAGGRQFVEIRGKSIDFSWFRCSRYSIGRNKAAF